MTITCPKCKTKLNLSDERVKPEGTRFRCAKCGAVLVYKGKGRKKVPDRGEETGVAAEPAPSGEISAPLEGGGTDDLPEREERPPEVPLRATPQSNSAGEEAPSLPPNMGESLLTLKKTTTADETDKVSWPAGGEGGKGVPGKAVMAGSAIAVLVLLLVAIFIFRSPETVPIKQPAPVPPAGQEAVSQLPDRATSQEGSATVTPAVTPPAAVPAEEMSSSSTPEEKAIGMVKGSDVLLRMTSVEAIVDKWTQDNAGKYKVVGWQAKKIDEQKYLVSYTALDGSTPKGFYFVADLQSGGVEDLAHNPELQKKYNIEYAH